MRKTTVLLATIALSAVGCEYQPSAGPSAVSTPSTKSAPARPEAPGLFSASIQHHAGLTNSGAIRVVANLSCPSGHTVLEAFVIVTQRGVSGQGGFAGVVCDGIARPYVALVQPIDGAFRQGAADASGYLLVCDAAGSCPSLNFSRRIVVRR